MATFERKDIIERSNLFQSTLDARQSRAERAVSVHGLSGTSYVGDLGEAATQILTLDDPHPADSTLPLIGARLDRSLRPGVVLGRGIYGHTKTSNPPGDPWLLAEERRFSSRRVKTYHRLVTQSDGSIEPEEITENSYVFMAGIKNESANLDDSRGILIRIRKAPVYQVRVLAGRLSTHPGDDVNDLAGTYNDDAVNINGITREAGTLRFEGANIDPVVDGSGNIVYFVHYLFSWCVRGWGEWKHYRVWLEGAGGWYWFVWHDDPDPSDDFTDAFPDYLNQGPSAGTASSGSGLLWR